MSQFGGQTKIEITADNKDAVSKLGATEQAFTEGAKKMSAQALGTASAFGAMAAAIGKVLDSVAAFQNAGAEIASEIERIRTAVGGETTLSGIDEFGKKLLNVQTVTAGIIKNLNAQRAQVETITDLMFAGIDPESKVIKLADALISGAKGLNTEESTRLLIQEAQTALAREQRDIQLERERSTREELFELIKIIPLQAQRKKELEEEEAAIKRRGETEKKVIQEVREERDKSHERAMEQFAELQAQQRASFGVSSSLSGNAQLNALAQIQRVHRLRGGR